MFYSIHPLILTLQCHLDSHHHHQFAFLKVPHLHLTFSEVRHLHSQPQDLDQLVVALQFRVLQLADYLEACLVVSLMFVQFLPISLG